MSFKYLKIIALCCFLVRYFVCVHASVCLRVRPCHQSQKTTSGVILRPPFSFFFAISLSGLELESRLSWLASEPQGSLPVSFSSAGIINVCHGT